MNVGGNAKPNSSFTLPDRLPILMDFPLETAIVSLPVFYANSVVHSILEPLIELMNDGDYQLIVRACPSTQQDGGSNTILGNQTYEDQISVPTGSFLIMVGGIAKEITDGEPDNLGFRVKWYDSGAQADLMGGYVHSNLLSGRFTQLPQTGTGMLTTVTGNKNLFILPSPLTITSPGQLNVQITNLSANTAVIDMAYYFAAPIGGFAQVKGAWVGNAVNK